MGCKDIEKMVESMKILDVLNRIENNEDSDIERKNKTTSIQHPTPPEANRTKVGDYTR